MRIYVNTFNLNKNYANLSILEKFIYIRVLIISDENDYDIIIVNTFFTSIEHFSFLLFV